MAEMARAASGQGLGGPEITGMGLVQRSLATLRANLFTYAGMTLIIMVAAGVVGGVLIGLAAALGGGIGGDGGGAIAGLLSFLGMLAIYAVAFVGLGAITRIALANLADRPVSIGSAISGAIPHVITLLVIAILFGIGAGIGFILLIVPGIIVSLGWYLAFSVAIAERAGPISSLKRSWSLTSGYRMKLFIAFLILFLLSIGLQILLAILQFIPVLGQIIGALVALAFFLLATPFGTIVPAVAYYEIRQAKEGVDTAEIAKVFE